MYNKEIDSPPEREKDPLDPIYIQAKCPTMTWADLPRSFATLRKWAVDAEDGGAGR